MQKGNMHNSRYINNSFIKKEVTMFLNNAPKKLLKKYPITDLIYITHDCCVYKSKQTDSGNYSIIKITPYLHKQHCILKSVSHINDVHLLTPFSVEKYKDFTVSVYPYKVSVIDKIISGKLCFDELLTLALDLCDGIIKLHSNNILHLDISPNNIYLNDDNTFCIGDFSFSQKKSNNKIRRNIYFTEGYSPPEFKAYSKNLVQINELSDEYSLAKTILSLCHGYNTSAKDHPVQNTTDIPEYFFDILNKASSEIQEYRYPSINAFKTELLSFKAKYDISEIKYYISFNSENNPFNNTKTRPMAKPHIEEPTPAIQKIINSPAFMTVAILLAVILPIKFFTLLIMPIKLQPTTSKIYPSPMKQKNLLQLSKKIKLITKTLILQKLIIVTKTLILQKLIAMTKTLIPQKLIAMTMSITQKLRKTTSINLLLKKLILKTRILLHYLKIVLKVHLILTLI